MAFARQSSFDSFRLLWDEVERARAGLTGGGPRGWRPTRLILRNYWLFEAEEFHFAHGRLFLRGANGSGKTTALTAAITLVLDGEKRRERFDTFGGSARSIHYYLLGDDEGKDFYREQRTGYVALEFEHGESGRFKTIGIGLSASRHRASRSVDFWGFVLRDGRRIGRGPNVELFGPDRVPLSRQQLAQLVGTGGTVVEGVQEYKELVNRELFGFLDTDRYDDLISVLLQVRQPKLNREMKPSTVCEALRMALPPLEEELVARVTGIIQEIDDARDALARTREIEQALEALDDAVATAQRYRAQEAAWHYREAAAAHARLREKQAEHVARRDGLQAALAEAVGRIAELEGQRARLAGALEELRRHEAFAQQEELARLQAELDEARGARQRQERLTTEAGERVAKARRSVEEAEGDFGAARERAGAALDRLRVAVREAAWDEAEPFVQAAARALEEEPFDVPGQARFAAEGEERIARLRAVLRLLREQDRAESALRQRKAELESAQGGWREAVDDRDRALQQVAAARNALLEAIAAWGAGCRVLSVSDELLEAVFTAIEAYDPGASGHPRDALEPVRAAHAGREGELREAARQAAVERARVDDRIRQVESDIATLLSQPELHPTRTPELERARAALAAAGIAGVPLYQCADFRAGVEPAAAARVERALEAAGLLDALVVRPADAARAETVLAEAGLGDRWIAPPDDGRPGAGTLADLLQPDGNALEPAAVQAVLGWVAVGDREGRDGEGAARAFPAALSTVGRWRHGLLAGLVPHEPGEVRYIGAATRRRRREEALAERRAELARLQRELEAAREAEAAIAADHVELAAELKRVVDLRDFDVLKAGCDRYLDRSKAVERAGAAVTAAERQEQTARAELEAARERLVAAREAEPASRGRDAEGCEALMQRTSQAVAAAAQLVDLGREIARQLKHQRQLQQHLTDAQSVSEQERQRSEAAARRVELLAGRCEALEEVLTSPDVAVVYRRHAELQAEAKGVEEDLIRRRDDRARTETNLVHAQRDVERVDGEVAQAATRREECHAELHVSLRGYPTLGEELRLFEGGPEGRDAAAASLLKRRSEDGRVEAIQKNLSGAIGAVSKAYYEHHSKLIDFHPLLDEHQGFIWLHEGHAQVTPHLLAGRQAAEVRRHEQFVRDAETRLYEEIILRQVASAIRDRIHRAEEWTSQINAVLADRPMANGERFELRWRPVVDESGGGGIAGGVELLRRHVDQLDDEDVAMLVERFRAEVNRVREQDQRGSLSEGFAQALEKALDYRYWFEFSIWSRPPEASGNGQLAFAPSGAPTPFSALPEVAATVDLVRRPAARQITDHRYGTRSGAEKSLSLYVPLLAAGHARYAAAAPDAPRLVALDEAFAGVDAKNTREMFKLMVELDFSWIMTSEKLWGQSDVLPAATTYELIREGSEVVAIPFLWDGRVRQAVVDPLTAALSADGRGIDDVHG